MFIHTRIAQQTKKYLVFALFVSQKFNLFRKKWLLLCSLGDGYFAVNGILPLEAILPHNICEWSILMMHGTCKFVLFLIANLR